MMDTVVDKAYDESQARRQSVQSLPDAKAGESDSSFFWLSPGRAILLPAPRTRSRLVSLDAYYHHPYNWMGQSAIAGQGKKIAATPWIIKGKNRVPYFQDVLRSAEFGRGWDVFCQKAYLDYSRYDTGAWVEVTGPGNPLRPLTGAATGLSLLDPLHTYPTGDPAYPAIYYDRKGSKHLLHASRVFQLVDAPETSDENPGYGMCALTRAISVVNQQINMNRYVDVNLDELPPPGLVVASNVEKNIRDAAFNLYRQEQATDTLPPWGRTAWFYSVSPEMPAKLEIITFAQAPANWDYEKYTNLHVNAWAMALGVDVQELWQLVGGNIGSAGQSEILHAKSQQRSFGAFLSRLTRLINDILPPSLEFEFVIKDPLAEKANADVATAWAGFTAEVAATLSSDEQRRLLASVVEQYRDVVTDAEGVVTTLTDADPEGPDQVIEDTAPAPSTSVPPDEQVTADDRKDISTTRAAFEADLAAMMTAAQDGDLTRRRSGVVQRALIAKYGRRAFVDGLRDSGAGSEPTAAEDGIVNALIADQSTFVTGFLDSLFSGASVDAEDRVQLWWNKSLQPFYDAGRLAADANGLYEFTGTDGEHTCATCQRLQGKRMRLQDWTAQKLRPGTDTEHFECKGFRCKHTLTKVVSG